MATKTRLGEGCRLLPRFLQNGRTAADLRINLPRDRRAAHGDQLGEQPAKGLRLAQDQWIVEQIKQKGLDGIEAIRPAEIVDDNGRASHVIRPDLTLHADARPTRYRTVRRRGPAVLPA